MSSFEFQPAGPPFFRWMGPFSPARGTYSGFRFHAGRLGTWVEVPGSREFWSIARTPGAHHLSEQVLNRWGGGRVLLLANGVVVKPLPGPEEVGIRAVLGVFSGSVVLVAPHGKEFDMGALDGLRAGAPWAGPKTTGLECVIQPHGALVCEWYHPAEYGREGVLAAVREPDEHLIAGFRRARPSDVAGRVRVTANGLVITNRLEPDGSWRTLYVGRIERESLIFDSSWIRGESI